MCIRLDSASELQIFSTLTKLVCTYYHILCNREKTSAQEEEDEDKEENKDNGAPKKRTYSADYTSRRSSVDGSVVQDDTMVRVSPFLVQLVTSSNCSRCLTL